MTTAAVTPVTSARTTKSRIGLVVLGVLLALEGYGISRSGSSDMSDRMSSPSVMSVSYSHAH